ncbi:MAG: extracellular solute-binding protein [Anaerolineae bacterium]|nr:extracellular solute-binding protein [Anaerolineae bacterium]
MKKHALSRREFLRMSAVAAVGAALASCARGTEFASEQETVEEAPVPEAIELTYWVNAGDRRFGIYQETLDWFEEENPNLSVKMEALTGDGVAQQQKTLVAIASGSAPDIVHVDNPFVNQVVGLGVSLPLDELDGYQEIEEALWPGTIDTHIFDGHTWALPVRGNSYQYYYDKDLAAAAGLDPDSPPVYLSDLTEWAAAMTERDASGMVVKYGYDRTGPTDARWACHAWYTMLWGYGGDLLTEDGHAAWNSDAGEKALQWWMDLVEAESSPAVSIDNSMALGHAASMCTGEWEIQTLKNELGINLGVSKFPYPEGGVHKISLGGRCMMMYKMNTHPGEGWMLMKHIMSKRAQMHVTKALEGLTPLVDVLDDPWWDENPEYKLTHQDMANSVATPHTPYYMEHIDILMKMYEKALGGVMGARQALDEAADEFNQIVDTGDK